MGRMTHFPARRDALQEDALQEVDEESMGQSGTRACTGCQKDFRPHSDKFSEHLNRRTDAQPSRDSRSRNY